MRGQRVAAAALTGLALAGCTHQLESTAAPSTSSSSSSSSPSSSSPAPSVTPTLSPPTSSDTALPSPTASSTAYADQPGSRVVADMVAAVAAATSVHYFGSLDQGGTPVDVEMKVGRAGATGTVDFPVGRVELLRVGTTVYLRAVSAVWRAQGVTQARALSAVAGRWVLLPADYAARFRVFTDVSYLIAGFRQPSYAVTGTRIVQGSQAVELRDATGTVLTVASGAPHVPLTITSATGKGTLTFANWNQPLRVVRPANPVDLAALSKG